MKDSLAMSLKTNGGKMSDFWLLAMLMKIKNIQFFSRDLDDREGSYVNNVPGAKYKGCRPSAIRPGLLAFCKPKRQSPSWSRSCSLGI